MFLTLKVKKKKKKNQQSLQMGGRLRSVRWGENLGLSRRIKSNHPLSNWSGDPFPVGVRKSSEDQNRDRETFPCWKRGFTCQAMKKVFRSWKNKKISHRVLWKKCSFTNTLILAQWHFCGFLSYVIIVFKKIVLFKPLNVQKCVMEIVETNIVWKTQFSVNWFSTNVQMIF